VLNEAVVPPASEGLEHDAHSGDRDEPGEKILLWVPRRQVALTLAG